MMKLSKKEIKELLKQFESGTGLKIQDKKEYVLSSKFGDIKVTFDLDSNLPTIYTKLVSFKYGVFDAFKEFAAFGYNSNTGKNNYHGLDAIYNFLNMIVVSHDITKSKDAMTAKISQSMFDKTGVNKRYDISIYKGGVLDDSVTCISYMEATQTAINLDATVLRSA